MMKIIGLLLLILPLILPLTGYKIKNLSKYLKLPKKAKSRECAFYNSETCQSNANCSSTQLCDISYDYVQCFASWKNSSDTGVNVLYKGCFYQDAASCEDQCISKEPVDTKVMYCCCHGDFCNNAFYWDPPKIPILDAHALPVHSSNKILLIVGLTTGVLVFLCILSTIFVFYYKKRKLSHFIEVSTVETATPVPQVSFPNICSKQIQLLEVKAQGRFGAVWKASYCNNYIAVKIFPQQDFESWQTEKNIYCLPQMKHENILHFIGVEQRGESSKEELWLLTAYHIHGSLYDYLKSNAVSWPEVCKIGESMCRGLAFLHSECPADKIAKLKPAIAHRDFKSKNVLIKYNLTACIADFGLATTFYPGQTPSTTHGPVGTRRYMAPEVLEGAISFQRDAFLPIDMYACALVLWELLTRCTAQGELVSDYALPFEEEVGLHPTLDEMQDFVVANRRRPHIPDTWHEHSGLHAVTQMIREAWDHDAEARLSASCIVERFCECVIQITKPTF